MAENIVNIPMDKFDDATLRIEAAGAIVRALSIQIQNDDRVEIGRPSNEVIHDALFGASLLLEDATKALGAR